ncbi:MAG: hypothetical protein ABIJ56_00665 [Pseudomonadota bacterium]
MMRITLLIFSVMLLFLGACAPEGVGDPCDPVSCPAPAEDDLEREWKRCDWDQDEIYLEGRSLQCRTRVCMVYQIDYNYQNPYITEDIQGPYCTRPCGSGANYSECPAGYCCVKIVTSTEASVSGYYCAKKDDLYKGDNAVIPHACDLIDNCYKEGSTSYTVDSYTPEECR